MKVALTKRRLRILVLSVLAISVTVAVWNALHREQGEARLEVVAMEPQGDRYLLRVRLFNGCNRSLIMDGIPPDIPAFHLNYVDTQIGNTSVFFEYSREGQVISPHSVTTFMTQRIAPGETREITISVIPYDVDGRELVIRGLSWDPYPWWVRCYQFIPKAVRPSANRRYYMFKSKSFQVSNLGS